MPIHPEYYVDPISKYELWIDKKTNLPYKERREMAHHTSIETISDVKINTLQSEDFMVSDYFPHGYSFRIKGKDKGEISFSKVDLFGKTAPGWSLYSADDQQVSLKDIKSKVTILMFTSINCGPCKVAIPFINQLTSEYGKDDLEIVAIECATRSMRALKMYRDNNDIRYTWLQSDDKVIKDYGILGYPIFFVLDESNVVRKIINGYNQQSFGNEIRETIRELL
ncbi:MAG: TlpA disulfide reductase family protein [Proteiniphilum sp.]|uniref:peroxiredoxin family protein n=1 Tax=Proteiniphilum sp. TaxID=1926877 RepID=UPI002B1F948C|nr:TlpA disulfide reductase family protein [Proteiniphilum sp.]MEA5128493.1 TlpA disulfide reductase family protein [Proteiniphilum sp.]